MSALPILGYIPWPLASGNDLKAYCDQINSQKNLQENSYIKLLNNFHSAAKQPGYFNRLCCCYEDLQIILSKIPDTVWQSGEIQAKILTISICIESQLTHKIYSYGEAFFSKIPKIKKVSQLHTINANICMIIDLLPKAFDALQSPLNTCRAMSLQRMKELKKFS